MANFSTLNLARILWVIWRKLLYYCSYSRLAEIDQVLAVVLNSWKTVGTNEESGIPLKMDYSELCWFPQVGAVN